MVHLLLALKASGKIELDVKFAIFSSGFLSLSSVHENLVESFIDLPSMHIFGKNDNIVCSERSQNLSEKFPNPVIIIHDGGHFVPSLNPFKSIFIEFLEKFIPKS